MSLLCLTLSFSLHFFVATRVNFSCPEEYQTLNGILFQMCRLLSLRVTRLLPTGTVFENGSNLEALVYSIFTIG
jgi:hypothetical protein